MNHHECHHDILADLTGIDRINAIAAHLESLPQVQRDPVTRAYQRSLPAWEAAELKYFWSLHSRDSQLPPDGDWDSWLILAGRGFGKTRTGAEWVRAQVESGKAFRVALVARSLPEAQFVMIEGESGIIAACPPWNKPWYEPSKRKLTWPNGAFALAFSSHEPDQLRGPQFHAAWCDEMAAWEYPEQTWDNLSFALRLGRYPRAVITTTPKPIELIRSLPNRAGVHVTRGSTFENQHNLPTAFLNGLIEQYDGTRLGRQEIHAELIDQDENALWKREWIEKARLRTSPRMSRVVVAVDPALSTKPTSSETGIVVAGADRQRKEVYVLADESARLTPNSWALRVIHLYDKFNASMIVVEDNAGGQMVKTTLTNAVERNLPIRTVHARSGKFVRAEPVASLYEQSLPRTPIRGPRTPRRPVPIPRRPDVYLDARPRPIPLTRPRRRPSPRHHQPRPRAHPHHLLVTVNTNQLAPLLRERACPVLRYGGWGEGE